MTLTFYWANKPLLELFFVVFESGLVFHEVVCILKLGGMISPDSGKMAFEGV